MITGSANETKLLSEANWDGGTVMVEQGDLDLCPPREHVLWQVHHYGDDGQDFGPTGFLVCDLCLGWAKEP